MHINDTHSQPACMPGYKIDGSARWRRSLPACICLSLCLGLSVCLSVCVCGSAGAADVRLIYGARDINAPNTCT